RDIARNKTKYEHQARLEVRQELFRPGRPFTPDEAKAQTLTAERDALDKMVKTGRASHADTQRLQQLTTQINLGHEPTPDEAKTLQGLTAERDKLQRETASGKGKSGDLAKLEVLQKEIDQVGRATGEEGKEDTESDGGAA